MLAYIPWMFVRKKYVSYWFEPSCIWTGMYNLYLFTFYIEDYKSIPYLKNIFYNSRIFIKSKIELKKSMDNWKWVVIYLNKVRFLTRKKLILKIFLKRDNNKFKLEFDPFIRSCTIATRYMTNTYIQNINKHRKIFFVMRLKIKIYFWYIWNNDIDFLGGNLKWRYL